MMKWQLLFINCSDISQKVTYLDDNVTSYGEVTWQSFREDCNLVKHRVGVFIPDDTVGCRLTDRIMMSIRTAPSPPSGTI